MVSKAEIEKLREQGMTIKAVCERLEITPYTYKKIIGGGSESKKKVNKNYPELFRQLANNSSHVDNYLAASSTIVNEQIKPYLTFDDIPGELKYYPGENIITSNTHRGQRKLFLSELEFLTLVTKERSRLKTPSLDAKIQFIVIYVGAAPNNKMFLLHLLFPDVLFILIDPEPFNINVKGVTHRSKEVKQILHLRVNDSVEYRGLRNESPDYVKTIKSSIAAKSDVRIFIIEDYMTTKLGERLSVLEQTYFISDIRTTIDNKTPTNFDIIWNQAQQLCWISVLQPKMWMVKFRIPYFDAENVANDRVIENVTNPIMSADFLFARMNLNVDFVADYQQRKFHFYKGTVYLQCFPGYKSGETRLIGNDFEIIEYSLEKYESKMYFYNTISRPFQLHHNPNADESLGFDYCNCCAKENYLWEQYQKIVDTPKPVKEYVLLLTDYTNQPLIKDSHGRFFGYNEDYLKFVISNSENLNKYETKDSAKYRERSRNMLKKQIQTGKMKLNHGKQHK